MIPDELSIENCWSNPDIHIRYLQKGFIHIEFKNNSNATIEIENISCEFETEDGMPPYKPTINTLVSIPPKNLCQMQIPFTAELSLKLYTINYVVSARYRRSDTQELRDITFDYPRKTIVVNPVRQSSKIFFISHKDPQDKKLATGLDYYLKKIGFEGYVAEDDRRPGLDLWHDKIYPSIEYCVALIVIWTSNAMKDQKKILREVKYAKKYGKTTILLVGKDVKIPKILSGNKEYVQISDHDDNTDDFIQFVIDLERNYSEGRYG